ncbi:hypothetical protein GUJ93_ZPchr0003g17792 [Zizania palustris]|uniref:Uncharacterized protein n=1 Tax=Zizania palustris TaxID=103762 RepID=A0A8J5VX23_ZIZPA|nr:hypothetical protein GUJ93_ZPchr0003g17792 [Zizania palustris]
MAMSSFNATMEYGPRPGVRDCPVSSETEQLLVKSGGAMGFLTRRRLAARSRPSTAAARDELLSSPRSRPLLPIESRVAVSVFHWLL